MRLSAALFACIAAANSDENALAVPHYDLQSGLESRANTARIKCALHHNAATPCSSSRQHSEKRRNGSSDSSCAISCAISRNSLNVLLGLE